MTEKSIDELARELSGAPPPRLVKRSEATISDLDQSLRNDAVQIVDDSGTDDDGSDD